jgi:hypothetical protein
VNRSKGDGTDTEVGFGSDVARDDWNRYGGNHVTSASAEPDDAIGRLVPAVSDRDVLRDDLYLEYRREAGSVEEAPESDRNRRRHMANVAGLSAFGVIGLAVALMVVATSPAVEGPSPSPSRFVATVTPQRSGQPVGSPLPTRTTSAAHVGVIIDLPMAISLPDRDQPPDDGSTIYLTGPSGGFSLDPGSGNVKTIYGGPAFVGGMRRTVVASGLWISSWSSDFGSCGPACWPSATTYRLDYETGNVTVTLPGTYLIGATSEGIWVATADHLELLEPGNGVLLGTTPWSITAEPRVGCDKLWFYAPALTKDKTATAKLGQVGPSTGALLSSIDLDANLVYGPTFVESQCWMMTGRGGASAQSTTLAWIGDDGRLDSVRRYSTKSIVTLNREFWAYTPDGRIQRFEPIAGVGYGPIYQLPVHPDNEDPVWLFSGGRSLWMIDGAQLVGFDIPTGATGQRSVT